MIRVSSSSSRLEHLRLSGEATPSRQQAPSHEKKYTAYGSRVADGWLCISYCGRAWLDGDFAGPGQENGSTTGLLAKSSRIKLP